MPTFPEIFVFRASARKLRSDAADLEILDLIPRQLCDMELLVVFGFNPLKSFLRGEDHNRVVGYMRLSAGSFWPIPLTLTRSENCSARPAGRDPCHRERLSPADTRQDPRSFKVSGTDNSARPATYPRHNQAGRVYPGSAAGGFQQPVRNVFRVRRPYCSKR
ncbi:hypothetical protein [Roseobacter sp.]|uniref:hypothetical protein n=1 Tax=Roseobacter sp. TaxID=1907202 RepID=UPI00344F0B43